MSSEGDGKLRLSERRRKISFCMPSDSRFDRRSTGGRSTTYWKSDTVRFVFDLFERRKFKSLSKTNAEVTPTGVYIRSRSVPRANHALNGTLLGAFCIYSSVGIYSVRSYRDGFLRPKKVERAGVDTPFFVYVGIKGIRNNLAWVFVRAKQKDKAIKSI